MQLISTQSPTHPNRLPGHPATPAKHSTDRPPLPRPAFLARALVCWSGTGVWRDCVRGERASERPRARAAAPGVNRGGVAAAAVFVATPFFTDAAVDWSTPLPDAPSALWPRPQPPSCAMANPAASDAGWRHSMSREDRIKVCQHIMGKLSCTFASSTLALLLFARRHFRCFFLLSNRSSELTLYLFPFWALTFAMHFCFCLRCLAFFFAPFSVSPLCSVLPDGPTASPSRKDKCI